MAASPAAPARLLRLPLLLAAALATGPSGVAASNGGAGSVSAVQKVIELLEGMAAKAKADKNAEEVDFTKFQQFCDDTTASKTRDVAKASELIESLSADTAKLQADIDEIGEKIDELHQSADKAGMDLKAAKDQREKDRAGYEAEIQDHAETSYALERAIAVLQKQNYDRGQAEEALLQLSQSHALPESARRTVMALVQLQGKGDDDFLSREAPEAAGYEFQSGGIVELLKKLHGEFSQKHAEAEKEEMNSRMAHEMLSQDLTDTIEGAKSDIADRNEWVQEKSELLAKKKKELTATTRDHDSDAKYLADLKVECIEKGKSFQEKQGLRAEEIEVIEKAAEIMRSPDVMGNAEEHLPAAFIQRGAALAQLRASSPPEAGKLRRALAGFLRGEGARLKSSRLGMLAERVSTSADPFVKVKKLIQDLITTLLKEEGQETEHKGWCDTELGTNKQTRAKLQAKTDKLSAQIEQGQAAIADATQRSAELSKEVTELNKAISEATTIRQEEKSKNEEAIKDAEAAQRAIASAKQVLEEFYRKASTATALVEVAEPIQYDRIGNEEVKMGSEEWNSLANPNFKGEVDRGHKEGMQTFGKTYTGQLDEAGGVLAFLEVIAGDFGKLEAETLALEREAVDAYKAFMADSNKAVAVKTKESELLEADRRQEEAEVRTNTRDLKSTQDQALAADRYYEKLKPTCVDTGITYEGRAKARAQEIQSLQEALRILKAED